jgi:hypothetical protein
MHFTMALALANIACSYPKGTGGLICWSVTESRGCLWKASDQYKTTARLRSLQLRGGSWFGKSRVPWSILSCSRIFRYFSSGEALHTSPVSLKTQSKVDSSNDRSGIAPDDDPDGDLIEHDEPTTLPSLSKETELDPAHFERTLSLWALRLPANGVAAARAALRDRVFRRPHLKPVLICEDDPAFRLVLLAPDAGSEVRPTQLKWIVAHMLSHMQNTMCAKCPNESFSLASPFSSLESINSKKNHS